MLTELKWEIFLGTSVSVLLCNRVAAEISHYVSNYHTHSILHKLVQPLGQISSNHWSVRPISSINPLKQLLNLIWQKKEQPIINWWLQTAKQINETMRLHSNYVDSQSSEAASTWPGSYSTSLTGVTIKLKETQHLRNCYDKVAKSKLRKRLVTYSHPLLFTISLPCQAKLSISYRNQVDQSREKLYSQ